MEQARARCQRALRVSSARGHQLTGKGPGPPVVLWLSRFGFAVRRSAQSPVEPAAQRREPLWPVTRLEDFTARIKDGLQHADWQTKGDLVRALVRRVQQLARLSAQHEVGGSDMDINAGAIADGERTVERVGRENFDFLLEVASGRRTYSERLGHKEFVPWRTAWLSRNKRHRIPQDRIRRQQPQNPPIKRSQPTLMPDRQIEQDGIGQLVVPHDASANFAANIHNSALKRPEAMRAVRRHLG